MAHCCPQHESDAFRAESVAASAPRVREIRSGSRIGRMLHASLLEPMRARLAERRRLALRRYELLNLDEHMRDDIGVTPADVERLTGCLPTDASTPTCGTEPWRWFNDTHFNR